MSTCCRVTKNGPSLAYHLTELVSTHSSISLTAEKEDLGTIGINFP